MKTLFSVLAGLLTFGFGFWANAKLINWVLTQFPQSAHEWLGVVRIGLWVVTFSFTFGISFYLAIGVGGLVAMIFKTSESKSAIRLIRNRK